MNNSASSAASMTCLKFFTALTAIVFLSASLNAEMDPRRPSLTLQMENDLFGFSDRHYTSGARAAWLSADHRTDELPEPWRNIDQAIPYWNHQSFYAKNFGIAIGHHIYTPNDLGATKVLKNEHPYASWLYLESSIHTKNQNHLNSLQLSLGIVGPAALGETAQKAIHAITSSQYPRGWHHQLKNEPTLMLTFEHHTWWPLLQKPFGIDALTYGQINLGNVRTDLAIGGIIRAGWQLPSDFGPNTISLNSYNHNLSNNPHTVSPRHQFSAYAFAGFTGRLVARNIFLDGNTFADSHRVSKRPYTGELRFGAAVVWRNIEITYTQTIKSYEFYGQQYGNDWYGSLSISIGL